MPLENEQLSLASLMTLASEKLSANGYRVERQPDFGEFSREQTLLAEDDFGVLAIVGFESWTQLENQWPEAQAELVGLIGRRLTRSAPKAWDGYLLLFCAGRAPEQVGISAIERDTTRVRKIVATADALKTTGDVVRILDPFLPLTIAEGEKGVTDALDVLPQLLRGEVSPRATTTVITAFKNMEPPLERLHTMDGEL